MLHSRKMAVAGTIAALSLAAAPLAAAATDAHAPSPDRTHRVEKKSPDRPGSRDRFDVRDATNHR